MGWAGEIDSQERTPLSTKIQTTKTSCKRKATCEPAALQLSRWLFENVGDAGIEGGDEAQRVAQHVERPQRPALNPCSRQCASRGIQAYRQAGSLPRHDNQPLLDVVVLDAVVDAPARTKRVHQLHLIQHNRHILDLGCGSRDA